MRDFDRHRCGSITETQFLSCLSMSKLFFSRKESELLINRYRNSEKEKEVLWRNFCDEIDQVFVVKELEKRNDIDTIKGITKTSFSLSELSLPDQALLQDILKEDILEKLNSFMGREGLILTLQQIHLIMGEIFIWIMMIIGHMILVFL